MYNMHSRKRSNLPIFRRILMCQTMAASGSAPLGRTWPFSPVSILIGLNLRSVTMHDGYVKHQGPRLDIPPDGGKLVPGVPSLIKSSMRPSSSSSSYLGK